MPKKDPHDDKDPKISDIDRHPDTPTAAGMTHGELIARNHQVAKSLGSGGIEEQPAFAGIPLGPYEPIDRKSSDK